MRRAPALAALAGWLSALSLALVISAFPGFALGQEAATLPASAAAPEFAPGVLTTIEPHLDPADTVSTHDIVELRANQKLARKPSLLSSTRTLFEKAQGTQFRRDIWCLEFTFKPLRMLEVDLPQPTGKMQRKLVWYMVYRVRNTGAGIRPVEQPDGSFLTAPQEIGQQRFVPEFLLASFERDRQDQPIRKNYLDRVMPSAVAAIARREMPSGHELLNSVELAERMLDPETGRSAAGLWGVATWEDIDPELDFFAIFVGGLTNAYLWEDPAEFTLGDPPGTGRQFQRKMLQLNFWRPGDSYKQNESEIRFGTAPGMAHFYKTPEGVAYQWVFR
jgi:hypothetical protein